MMPRQGSALPDDAAARADRHTQAKLSRIAGRAKTALWLHVGRSPLRFAAKRFYPHLVPTIAKA
jgi:hypothetical protein